MIILLNGTSSSGKTMIAKALNLISPEPFVHIGIDMIYSIMPLDFINAGTRSAEGFKIVRDETDKERPVKVDFGPFGQQVRNCSPQIAKLLSDAGLNLIIDEVLVGDQFLEGYVKTLKHNKTYFVGVTCELEALKERELLRADRANGLAEGQYKVVHEPERFYDLMVDTTNTSPFKGARQIMDFVAKNPTPTSMKKCAERQGS